jgi:hypothetical protein
MEMVTGIRKAVIAGALAAFATALFAAPAGARLPEGATARPSHQRAAATAASTANSIYAAGCANGTIPDNTTGSDNNNYEYYGSPCSS